LGFPLKGVLPYISLIGVGRPKRYGLLRCFGQKTGVHFTHFGLESGMVFKGSTGVYEGLDLLFQFQVNWKKE